MDRGWVRRRLGWVLGTSLVIGMGACGAKMEESDPASNQGVPEGSGGSGAGRRPMVPGIPKITEGGRPTTNPDGDLPSCGSPGYAGEPHGISGAPFCGGCSTPSYHVECNRRVVTATPSTGEPDYGRFGEPDRACQGAQAEASGTAGAANESAGAPSGTSGAGGAGGLPDACETFVDPPTTYFDEGCIGSDDVDRAGSCIIDGECCVIVSHIYCGV
jgi:hypothetical protein